MYICMLSKHGQSWLHASPASRLGCVAGRRRLELFGEDHNIRPGWVTVGSNLTSSNFNPQVTSMKTFCKSLYIYVTIPMIITDSRSSQCRIISRTNCSDFCTAHNHNRGCTCSSLSCLFWNQASMHTWALRCANASSSNSLCYCAGLRWQFQDD